ncbi:MAG: RecQ family ATP-dependent DNA helicase, partial [Cytophagales bacterium]|nr:RecQ family ATP-dependent DNA helicase [Cytophagales bacterium]
EIDITLDNCIYGGTKLLYVSPERLLTDIFLERSRKMKINLLAVDEAHCISEWGHDFRPAYLQIKEFKEHIKPTKNIALTASATDGVKKDIISHLDYTHPEVFIKSFKRVNLSYSCFQLGDKERKLEEILHNVPGSSIVYVRNRRKTKDVSDWLNKIRIPSDFYHAGLTFDERSAKQDRWIQNRTRVIVATNAFGMGIDKPDVRTVIHLDLTNSLEAYYQEAGRAGRDGKKSFAVVLYDQKDILSLEENLEENFPQFHFLRHVYQSLINHLQLLPSSSLGLSQDFDLALFVKKYGLDSKKTYAALKILEKEGILQFNESFHSPSQLFIPMDNKRLYEFQVANANFDTFIKTVLRMYGGELFSHFMPIQESQLAQRLSINANEAVIILQKLNKLGVFNYSQKKENEQITMLYTGSVAALPISEKNILQKKERELARTQSVIKYVSQAVSCRSVAICSYFGEVTAMECGVCDICLDKKRKANQLELADSCRKTILQLFEQNEIIGIHQLPLLASTFRKELILEIVRELLDQNVLKYSSLEELTLVQK